MVIIAALIHQIIRILILVIIVQALLTFFLPPYNQVRQFLDRLTEPLLAPIRRILPQTGMIDFSPLVLIILLQILDMFLVNLLTRF